MNERAKYIEGHLVKTVASIPGGGEGAIAPPQ